MHYAGKLCEQRRQLVADNAGHVMQVISHTFSDIGGMNSPGDQLLVASPQPGNAVPPFSRRNPGLAAGSPSGSPRHAPIPNPMTPDSFNRNAGFSLLDGTAPTPQPRTNSRRRAMRLIPPSSAPEACICALLTPFKRDLKARGGCCCLCCAAGLSRCR